MSLLFLGKAPSCAFPMNAGAAEIQAFGVEPMTLTADGQTASWTTTNAGELYAAAGPSGFAAGGGAKLPFTSGTRVIEWQSILMPAGAGGGTTAIAYQLDLNLTTSITAGGVIVRMYMRKDGTRYIGVLTDADGDGSYTVQYSNTAASSFPSTVAIVADCTGGTVSVLLDGVAVTLTSATFTAGQYTAWVKAYQNSSLAAGDVGKTVGATLVTSAASMAGGYWNGVTDPCGNATGNILWYDLSTGSQNVPAGFTFTRNSGCLQWGVAAGQYKTIAANTYAPDYDPLTGLCRGFRSETAATNLLLWSADFSNAVWVGDNASKGAAGTLIEGGTAQSVTQTSAGGFLYQTVGTFTGAAHTVQVLVEKGANAVVTRLTMRNTTDGADVGSVSLTWATGAAVASGSGTAVAFKRRATGPNGGEVYLIALSGFIGTAGKTRQVRIFPDTTATNAVVYAHHAQLVSGTRVSSPIVTGAASAARQADVMSMLTLPAWFDQAKYTLFAEIEFEQWPEDASCSILSANDGTANNRVAVLSITIGTMQLRVTSGGATQAAIGVGTIQTGVIKSAGSSIANLFRFARNGSGGTEDTSGSMPTVTQINIGGDGTFVSPGGWIRRIGIAPRTMTTAELQALTA